MDLPVVPAANYGRVPVDWLECRFPGLLGLLFLTIPTMPQVESDQLMIDCVEHRRLRPLEE